MCTIEAAFVARGPGRPSPTLDDMIRLGRLGSDRRVAVAGQAGLAATLGLLRKGFDRAVCVCDRCAGEAGESDALLLTGPLDGDGLAELVGRTARLLRPRATIVAHEASLDADAGLFRALARHGLEVDWVVHDLRRTCLAALGVHRRSASVANPSLALAA